MKEIEIRRAAEVMNASRQYLVKVLEQEDIPHRKTGDQLFINFEEFERFVETMEKNGTFHWTNLPSRLSGWIWGIS